MEFIFLILILVILGISYKIVDKTPDNIISFRETFNLTEMPIVTFFAGKNKINFLIDTGSSKSHISQKASKFITGTEKLCTTNMTSATGTEEMECKIVDTVLTYNDKDYNIELCVNKSLDISFKDLKEREGIHLHGILGNDFLNNYSYVIDFEKYLAYSKK